jgi:hypothetical protein
MIIVFDLNEHDRLYGRFHGATLAVLALSQA